MYRSLVDLERRHGFEGPAGVAGPEFHSFSLRDDPAGVWVADDNGRVVGIGFSWVTGPLWFLANLFVLPEYQGRGVGNALMQRTLEHARVNKVENRALISFAYNRVSIGLYVRHGLFPRMPLYMVSAPRDALARRIKIEGPRWRALTDSAADMDAVDRVDGAAVGFARSKQHHFLGQQSALTGMAFEDARNAGYAYVSSDGHIGPLAVSEPAIFVPALHAALRLAAAGKSENVSAFLPGLNEPAMSLALSLGMRLGRPMVLLSSRSFGDWSKHLPCHPGLL